MFTMKGQSEKSFNGNEIQLSLNQLLELSNYEVMFKNFSKLRLGISDYDINHHQPSEFYVQKRRKMVVPGTQASKLLDKTAEENKTVKKSKVENVKKNKQATIRLSKLSINIAESSAIVDPMNLQPQKQAFLIEVKEVKASKKKVQTINTKKQEDSDKLSNYTLKQFQKQRYIEQSTKKQTSKVYLSEFMKNNKIQKALQNEPNLSKYPKTQRSSPIIEKQSQVGHNNKSSHEKSIIEDPKPQKQINIVGTKSRLYQLPENYKNPSKSKSKNKTKKTKETSFIRKSPIKLINESELQNNSVLESYNPRLYHQYAATSKSNIIQRQQRLNNGHRKRINVKCEDIIPTQDFQGQVSHLQQSNAEYNHKEQLQQFPRQQHIISVQLQPPQTRKSPKAQINVTCFDFFEIDMKPLNRQAKKPQQSIIMVEIKPDLKSKQELKVSINPKSQNIIIEHKPHQPMIQADKPSPIMKSARKKIFQQSTSKSFRVEAENSNIELSNLSQEQMKMLLGGKGNKYKQAIILEYIKENRRCMAT